MGRSIMIITTGHNIEGYEIVEYLDVLTAEYAFQTTYLKGFFSKELFNVDNGLGTITKGHTGTIGAYNSIILKGLMHQAQKVEADGIISVSFQFSSVTNDFVMIIGTGTAVKLKKKHKDNEIDNRKFSALIDAMYLEKVLGDNKDVAIEIQERKNAIAVQRELTKNKEQAWSGAKEKKQSINEDIMAMDQKISELKSVIAKLTAYGRDNLKPQITEKNEKLAEISIEKTMLERKRETIQAEFAQYEAEYLHEYDKLQNAIKDLKEFEGSL